VRSIGRLVAANLAPHISITITSRNVRDVAPVVRFALDRGLTFSSNFFRDNACAADLQHEESEMTAGLRAAYSVIEELLPPWSVLDSVLDRGQLLQRAPGLHVAELVRRRLQRGDLPRHQPIRRALPELQHLQGHLPGGGGTGRSARGQVRRERGHHTVTLGATKRSACSSTHCANVRAGWPVTRSTVSTTVEASSGGEAYQPMT